jgi:hypothetical protein
MKARRQDIERLITDARPTQSRGFADGPEGQAALSRILQTDPEPAQRKPFVRRVLASAVIAAGGIAATAAVVVTLAPDAPPDWRPSTGSFMCATSGLKHQADTLAMSGESPVDACRRVWGSVFREDPPENLFACVPRAGAYTPGPGPEPTAPGGLLYIVDGDGFSSAREACGAIGMFVAPPSVAEAPQGDADPTSPAVNSTPTGMHSN